MTNLEFSLICLNIQTLEIINQQYIPICKETVSCTQHLICEVWKSKNNKKIIMFFVEPTVASACREQNFFSSEPPESCKQRLIQNLLNKFKRLNVCWSQSLLRLSQHPFSQHFLKLRCVFFVFLSSFFITR